MRGGAWTWSRPGFVVLCAVKRLDASIATLFPGQEIEMACPLVVMIATANRPDLLLRTLKSLGECEKPTSYLETIVIENGSQNGTKEVLNAAPSWLRVRYLFQSLSNKSAALNRGLEEVVDSLVFFSDDDVRLHRLTLMAYATIAAENTGGEFFGGPVDVDYELKPPEWLKSYLPPSARGWSLGQQRQPVSRADFLGFNWAAFSRDVKAAGRFDTNRGPGSPTGSVGQEKEMQQRLLTRGVKAIYVPEALVWHYVPQERCSIEWTLARAYRNGIQAGIEQVSLDPNLPYLLGYPRWALREWIGKACNALTASVSRHPVARFEALYEYRYFTGVVRGLRVGREALLRSTSSGSPNNKDKANYLEGEGKRQGRA